MVSLMCLGMVMALPVGYREDVGYTELLNALGSQVPTGHEVEVVLCESTMALFQPRYFPGNAWATVNDLSSDFQVEDPNCNEGVEDCSRGATEYSSHAGQVAGYYYGDNSFAPDIPEVHVIQAEHYIELTQDFDMAEVLLTRGRVHNHSWVDWYNPPSNAGDLTQEQLDEHREQATDYYEQLTGYCDYLIDTHNYVNVVALNNGGSQPELYIQGYNSISVGMSSGGHSRGLTTINGAGRTKPDIVAPAAYTSYSTPIVSSAAALLLGAADEHARGADQSEVIKAILLAGATKEEFVNWSHTDTQPLDEVYGAGELNVYNSYYIMVRDRQTSSTDGSILSQAQGWDYDEVEEWGVRYYYFDVPVGKVMEKVSVILNWNASVAMRTVLDANLASTRLSNLDLSFWRAGDLVSGSALAQSTSSIDNVEHVYHPGLLGPGQYVLKVESVDAMPDSSVSPTQDYALAWRSSVRDPRTYEEWVLAHLTGFSDEVDEEDDPDRDGYPNIIEYAQNTAPLSLTSYNGEVLRLTSNYVQFIYRTREDLDDLDYKVGVSYDLDTWDWSEALVVYRESNRLDEVLYENTVTLDSSVRQLPKVFVRLQVER